MSVYVENGPLQASSGSAEVVRLIALGLGDLPER